MNNPLEKLDNFSKLILTETHPNKLRTACYDFYDFLCKIVEINDKSFDTNTYADTILSQGKAVSPLTAARCLWEYKRTFRFIRGISAAIDELKKRFPNEKIEILYAGCGPFATLLIPLLSNLSPAEISLTLLDYHEFSINAAKKIFQTFGFEKFNADFIQTDACTYKHPRKLHLVISETMQNALVNETQTAITLNLAPQLCENGLFVPQTISVKAGFAKLSTEFEKRERFYLGTILKLDSENVKKHGILEFSPVSLEIPPEIQKKNLNLMLFTQIQIFENFMLNDYDSSISSPKQIHTTVDISQINRIEFSYILDEKPRFEHRIF